MGKSVFVKGRGRTLDGGLTARGLRAELLRFGLADASTNITLSGDVVSVSGDTCDHAVVEQIILALGNIEGVSAVIENFPVACTPRFYTVVPGDTLDRIAATWLGCASRAADILDANRPVFTCARQVGHGQTLRLPYV